MAPLDPEELDRIAAEVSSLPAGEREGYITTTLSLDPADQRALWKHLKAAHTSPSASAVQREDSGPSPRPARPGPLPGTRLGRYTVVEKIGEGGMALIYRAVDTSLDREVAIKFLPAERAKDRERTARLLREARLLASLNHPNIVVIHAVEDAATSPFLVMELVPGKRLRELIPESGLALRQLLEYAIPVAEALAAAHAEGVTHRDLKPDNVMVLPDGRVKVLDFGIAKRALSEPNEREASTESLTGDRLIGTLAYMSPEQLRTEPARPATDVFSFGTLLFEMATGRLPFQGRSAIEAAAAILHEDPVPPSELSPLPYEFDAVVLSCLEKDLARRPPTLAPILERLLALRRRLERSAVEVLARDARAQLAGEGRGQRSVAIAPFQDLTPDGDQGYFCIGIAEEIATELSRVPNLRVALASRMDRDSVDPAEIGRLLAVDAVLDGSVRRAGDRMRISVRLTSVADGTLLHSERFDRPIVDALAVQEEVASNIARAFDVQLGPGRVSLRSGNSLAYVAYLRGRYFWGRRYEDGLKRALECFEEALELDPEMAEAHAGRADCFVILGHYGAMPPAEAYRAARDGARRALELAPGLPEAHATLGWIAAFFDWKRDRAETWFEKALELDPNYATAWEWRGIHYLSSGRPQEALRAIQKAQSIDPLSLMIGSILGWVHYEIGNVSEAQRILENVLEMEPRFAFAGYILGICRLAQGDADGAIRVLEQSALYSARERLSLAFLGWAYGRAARTAEAEAILAELAGPDRPGRASHVHRAMVLVGLDRSHQALDELEKAVDARESFFATIYQSRVYDRLRETERYAALVRRIGV